MSNDETTNGITKEDVTGHPGFESLGPAYYAARRIAESVMNNSDAEHPFKQVADKATKLISESLYDYIETHILSDLEVNFQGHLYRLVDDTVKAILSGQRWALDRYPLSRKYDGNQLRTAIFECVGDEMRNARIIDLEKEVVNLKETIETLRRYR